MGLVSEIWECISSFQKALKEKGEFSFLTHPLHLSSIDKDITYMFFAFEIAFIEFNIAFNGYYYELEKEENVKTSLENY